MKRAALVVCFLLISLTTAWAQFDTATVLGTVRDSTGAVLPGASVTLTNIDTGVSVTKVTDANGSYEFFTVRIGVYKVTAELSGFATASVGNVKVTIGARQRVDLGMAVGQLTEAVEVTAVVSPLETDSSQRGQVITREMAMELPSNGREYSSLVLLTTGARLSALNTGSASTVREGSFNVNGLRSTFNNFLLDGVDNNSYGTSNQGFSNQVMQPPPDAVAEFKVVTNNMSAEYGRSGGATINVAYASGTNRFHGTAWEFARNTALNSPGFFKPQDGKKPPLNRHQFGAVFGGPIVRNRAFFFADYEGFRQIRKNVTFVTIPTLAERRGILPVTVTHPVTGVVYPAGTQIPASAITPFAARVLADLPAPTNNGTANNYQTLQRFENSTDKFNGKVDFQINSRLTGLARYGRRDANIFDQPPIPLPSGGGGNGATLVENEQLATGITYSPSGHQLLEVRFGFSRTRGGKNPAALGSASAQEVYGIGGLPTDPRVVGGLPTQSITGCCDLGRQATNPQWQYPTVFNPKVNYTWTVGRHSVKTGYELQIVRTEVQDVNPLYGRDEYFGRFSRPAGVTSTDPSFNLADFMFGLRSRYALTNFFIANVLQNLHFGYVQDDWRVGDRLTLNLGVRYEYGTPQWERDNKLTNFDPVTGTMIQARDGSMYDRALMEPDRNNWAPRLGFAYSLTPRTVIRSGFGTSFIHFNRAGGGNMLMINGPQVITAVVSQANPNDPTFRPTQQGYPAGLTDPGRFDPLRANITYMPRDYRTSSVRSYFVSVQREVFRNTVVDVAYVGNRAKDLLLFANFNQARPNNPAGTLSLQSRRPIPTFGDITYAFNGGFSEYDSLQVRFESRVRGGLTLLSSFTWSRAIDNGSGSLEGPNGNFPAPQDFYNMDGDRGRSAYDQPFNSTTSFVWEVPVGRGRRFLSSLGGAADAVLGGWQLSGINNMWSGQPINFTYVASPAGQVSGIQQDFRGANNYRPNVIGDPLAPAGERTITNYFNRNNVVIPIDPSQPFGNARRNMLRSHAIFQFDFAASKNISLPWGGSKLQIRTEVFNLFNRTNFLAANGNRSAAAFGTITSAFDPRQVQFGLKLSF